MDPTAILHSHQLKKTPIRLGIIRALQHCENPLSENDIKETMGDLYDRVTFYRSVQTLIHAGILHRIVADNTTIRYALNYTQNGNKQDTDHIHFFCQRCNTVVCLEDVKTYHYKVPEGFAVEHCEVLIKGLCDKCAGLD